MPKMKLLCAALVVLGCSVVLVAQDNPLPPAKTPGEALANLSKIARAEFMGAAEAMPEDKYNFAPTNGEFKDVRTFAQQIKHVAAVNYIFASAILQEKSPVDTGGENGPDSIKSKAEIVKFAADSFDYLQKALLSINAKNQLDQVDSFFGKVPRLSIASFSNAHPFDHYGQMVEYLRMNGIIPPASRPQPKK